MSTLGTLQWNDAKCATGDARSLHLFFSEVPAEIAEAKQICAGCPMKLRCLEGAVERAEPWGVWGGHLFDKGQVIAGKRGRGRPRKDELKRQEELQRQIALEIGVIQADGFDEFEAEFDDNDDLEAEVA